ncbi:MAG TPA: hypothetical protein VG125_15535 [Pirellulales bacterium]|nr:hypothetical protein [Pirellulales bacterium]
MSHALAGGRTLAEVREPTSGRHQFPPYEHCGRDFAESSGYYVD